MYAAFVVYTLLRLNAIRLAAGIRDDVEAAGASADPYGTYVNFSWLAGTQVCTY
jgi:hypothetical protein